MNALSRNNEWKSYRKLWLGFLAVVLFVTLTVPINANTINSSNQSIGTVQIGNNSYIDLDRIMMLEANNSNVVAFTFTIHNNSNTEMNFMDYWVRVRSTSGSRFVANQINAGQESDIIPSNGQRTYSFYANVSQSLKLNNIVLDFIAWDFSIPSYERRLGSVNVPPSYKQSAAIGDMVDINILNTVVRTHIKKSGVISYDEFNRLNIELEFENMGRQGIPFETDYQYFVQTSEGYQYALTQKESLTELQPRVKNVLEISADIPSTMKKSDWKLVIVSKLANVDVPISFYDINLGAVAEDPDEDNNYNVGEQFIYENEDGIYSLTLKSIQRLPWENEDVIAAEMIIANADDKGLPLLDLNGVFKLDGFSLKEPTHVLHKDNILALGVGRSTSKTFYLKIPYTYDYEEVSILISEGPGGEEGSVRINEFFAATDDMKFTIIDENSKHSFNNIGKRADLKVVKTDIFKEDKTTAIRVLLEMENKERRSGELQQVSAYLRNIDDLYYPITVSEYNESISPSGKILISMITTVPNHVNIEDELHLIVGEQVSDEEDQFFINAVAFEVIIEEKLTQGNLLELDFTPYEISINNVRKDMISEELKFNFHYELSRDLEYELATEPGKLIFAFEQGDVFEYAEVDIESLKLGRHVGEFKLEIDQNDFYTKVGYLGNGFIIHIYESIDGHKRKIGAQLFQWG